MYYFLVQLVIYIIFIAVSKTQSGENKTGHPVAISAVIGVVFLIISFLVELPLRLIPTMRLLDNKWLYLFIVLVTDLVKITIPFCAILCMSGLFGNTKISKAVLIVSAVMIIISFTMNTYEVMSLYNMLDNFATGQIGFFTTLTGGPMSYSFGRIHLIVEFIPAVLQTIICLSNGDKKSVDIQEG